jgi:xanthine dehydrogenase accessory factor
MEQNSLAWKKIQMDYSRAGTLVPDSGRALVVIMTASHRGDATVLEQMLPKNLRYLGMMASRATAGHIMKQMLAKGFSPEQLKTVHSPVGLPINSRTPAEIAVSIAAEIIEVMNR